MIELRYLLKQFPRPRGIDDGMIQPPLPDFITIPVLQYRIVLRYEMEWIEPPVDTMVPKWSDWIDVPTVQAAPQPAVEQ